MIVSDKLFPTNILYAVDTIIQRLLSLCKRASDRLEVNDRIVDLSDLIEDILNGRFQMNLPPSFNIVTGGNSTKTSLDTSEPKAKREKRNQTKGQLQTKNQ